MWSRGNWRNFVPCGHAMKRRSTGADAADGGAGKRRAHSPKRPSGSRQQQRVHTPEGIADGGAGAGAASLEPLSAGKAKDTLMQQASHPIHLAHDQMIEKAQLEAQLRKNKAPAPAESAPEETGAGAGAGRAASAAAAAAHAGPGDSAADAGGASAKPTPVKGGAAKGDAGPQLVVGDSRAGPRNPRYAQLWREDRFSDVTVRVGEALFPAHRLVLAAESEVCTHGSAQACARGADCQPGCTRAPSACGPLHVARALH